MLVEPTGVESSAESSPFAGGYAPVWACRYGEDEFGCYADLEVRGVSQRFRWLPSGSFLMGSKDGEGFEDEHPQHAAAISGHWMADTACSQAFWAAVVRASGDTSLDPNPSRFTPKEPEQSQLPVEQVSWHDCQRFIELLSQCELRGRPPWLKEAEPDEQFRLPTEAEWERACRAGTTTKFSFGPQLTKKLANFSAKKTAPVEGAPYRPNPWGLWHMHGNVWEWCLDGRRLYSKEADANPVGPLEGDRRAVRGGGWFVGVGSTRSALRVFSHPVHRGDVLGFRLARGHRIQGPEAE